jgi:DNA-binding response OmpR family regulator
MSRGWQGGIMTIPPSGARLLLVEDDRDLSTMLAELLGEEGYAVTVAPDGHAGLHLGLVRPWDLLLVDRGLPGVEGVDLVRRLRQRGIATPALVLTARGTVADRVEGLDAGAQDYLVKPFEVEELLARLRALLGRATLGEGAAELPIGSRRLIVGEGRVVGGESEVILSRREALLLETLARRPRQVFTREKLLDHAFDNAETEGAVDTYVYYLRKKLGRDTIETVHGVGYRLGRS